MSGAERSETPEISAVVTSYFEEKTIERFFAKLRDALEATGRTYEIVLVNDGSTDSTAQIHRELFESHQCVSAAIDFFRNSGQLAAMTAGFCQARGEIIFSLDSDLQLDPAELGRLLDRYDEGADVVSGYRANRKDSFFRTLPSKLANAIMRRASGTALRDFGCTFKLYNAKLVKGHALGPFNLFNTAKVIGTAGRCEEVEVSHYPRAEGKSGWTLRKLWDFNMENVIEALQRPFQLLGGACAVLAGLFVLRLAIETFAPFKLISEVTNGLLLNVIVIGLLLQVAVMALLGEFALRAYLRLKGRPGYIIKTQLVRKNR